MSTLKRRRRTRAILAMLRAWPWLQAYKRDQARKLMEKPMLVYKKEDSFGVPSGGISPISNPMLASYRDENVKVYHGVTAKDVVLHFGVPLDAVRPGCTYTIERIELKEQFKCL